MLKHCRLKTSQFKKVSLLNLLRQMWLFTAFNFVYQELQIYKLESSILYTVTFLFNWVKIADPSFHAITYEISRSMNGKITVFIEYWIRTRLSRWEIGLVPKVILLKLFLDMILDQAPVVRKVDNSIHRINHYPVDSVVCFVITYPVDSDLSGG